MSRDDDGPLVTQAYVCPGVGQKLVLQDITLPPMKPTFVEVDITHCGLCRTDVHVRDNDWASSDYPVVLGHEGIGTIRKLGSAVYNFKVGDEIGITWIRDSCKTCDACLEGRENICRGTFQTLYLGKSAGKFGRDGCNEYGGCFSKVMRIDARFVIPIPRGLPPVVACPLLCGGGTVFEAVVDFVECGTRVGVASIGGLGTAAIKFAKSFGAHVTALSHGDAKREKCLKHLGCDAFYGCLGDENKMKELECKFDLIIDTCPINAPIAPFMDMLDFNGTYCRVGIPLANDNKFEYDFGSLINYQRKIAGSVVTGTRRMKRMLELCCNDLAYYSKDGEEWKAEIVPFSEVNEAMDKLKARENKTAWRYVLKW